MKVRYLNSLPVSIHLRDRRSGSIQLQLDEFMKVDSPIMEVSVVGHYKNIAVARTRWHKSIKVSGYPLRVVASAAKGALYIIKETSIAASN